MQMFHNYQKLTTLRIGSYLLVQYLILQAFLVVASYCVTRERMVWGPYVPTLNSNEYLSSYISIFWEI